MKKFILSIALIVIVFSSCSSVEADAEEAAKLNRKSMKYAKELNLEEAEKLYRESREIISRYKDTDKFEDFFTLYNKFMAETAEN